MDAIEASHPWFVSKRIFLGALLRAHIPSDRLLKALDVGCGSGAAMEFLKSKGFEVCGVDMSEDALAFCRQKNLDVVHGFADRIPYDDKTFDIVLALDVLEHLDRPQDAIREIERILKPGGLFIASVPAHQSLWSYHDELLHHRMRYNKTSFKNLFDGILPVKRITWAHATLLVPITLLRLIKKVFHIQSKTSDVRPIPRALSFLGNVAYLPERIWFSLFKRSPFGSSLIVVAQKDL